MSYNHNCTPIFRTVRGPIAPLSPQRSHQLMSKDTLQTLIQQAEKLTPDEKLSLAAQLEAIALQVDSE